ncbi:MAG: hypothetical protein H8D92_02565, partial [Pelagibacteraceae bacterium]|nr:hypothetical protein [Pelagibacteraceae bacterium]
MSKVKQWAENEAEKAVDTVIAKLKKSLINNDQAKTEIMNIDNLDLVGINADNVDEVLMA